MRDLSPVTPEFAEQLGKLIGSENVKPAEARYLEEPRGRFSAAPTVLVTPRSTMDVSKVVTTCHNFRIAIVPYAGGTGLVGGQTKPDGGPSAVILSLEKMDAIRDVDTSAGILTAEAGVILAEAQKAADEQGFLYPLSIASEGSARIGGTLATNAGGTQVIRYGNTRDFVLGIEAVMPDGGIYHGLKKLKKDNIGFDLRHLLIGSEGVLGIITAATVQLSPKPMEHVTGWFSVPDPEAAVDLLSRYQVDLSGLISSFELMNKLGLGFVRDYVPNVSLPTNEIPEWSVLVELGGGPGSNITERLGASFETALLDGLVSDGLVAQSSAQSDALWAVRESIPLGNRAVGAVSNHDISVPVSSIPHFIAEADAKVTSLGPVRVGAFGHVGDGNLHYNVFPQEGQSRDTLDHLRPAIKETVHDLVHAYHGSVAAEHGVGRMKVDDLEKYSDPTKISVMRRIKSALDPNGIMNPGVLFAAD